MSITCLSLYTQARPDEDYVLGECLYAGADESGDEGQVIRNLVSESVVDVL